MKLIRRSCILSITFLIVCAAAPNVLGKAYYAPANEMIIKSEVIAIVEIGRVEPVKMKGSNYSYSQVARAQVKRTLKGTLPAEVALYGGEDFICAHVQFEPGRFLVFLTRDKELFVGSNWHLSVRPIRNHKIEWYVPGKYVELGWKSLPEVLQQIEQELKTSKKTASTAFSDLLTAVPTIAVSGIKSASTLGAKLP